MTKKYLYLFLISLFIVSCYKETIVPITGDFNTAYVEGKESIPVIITISSTIKGADTYYWEFEGGIPSESTKANPGEITYNKAGNYNIKLTVNNQDGEKQIFSKTIAIKDAININFTPEIIQSNYLPVEVKITNNTQGEGLTYNWEFENANIASFEGKNPDNLIFTTPGNHNIKLSVSNGFETITQTQTITAAPHLVADFMWIPNFEDEDYQSPVRINLVNQSVSANTYHWTFEGGTPNSTTEESPKQVLFYTGTHQITLVATNDKGSKNISKTITVLPNSNLIVLNNVHFGINAAHHNNTKGAFYSTNLNQSFAANDINNNTSTLIDIAFQGLNSNFTYNKFISPSTVQNYGFEQLSNPQNTIFVNSQEFCNCGLNFTVEQFDAMTNDSPLIRLNIVNTPGGAQQFNDNFPRIVLFKTQNGQKGAIKVKNKVQNGSDSYLVCDIKVQK